MIKNFLQHNRFQENFAAFEQEDPHLRSLAALTYQYSAKWWQAMPLDVPGIYILTGGRQVGKSTSCKLLMHDCLQQKIFAPQNLFYLPCDEVFDATMLSELIREFLAQVSTEPFLLIIDEVTFVKHWDRVIKALADEGRFQQGLCVLTGSDTLILKEAAMSFPGRRGNADQTDFHLFPLRFAEYLHLLTKQAPSTLEEAQLRKHFDAYLLSGGYLRAINDVAEHGKVLPATYQTYEQWIRGDFLKQGKNERTLLSLLESLLNVGVDQISYAALTQKMGMITRDTCLDYCHLLKRMDVLFDLPAYDQNKKRGFPKKARKFHFFDPFICQTIYRWLQREGYVTATLNEADLVESVVASHCHQRGLAYYFKGKGEVDVIWLHDNHVRAIEVKWTNQVRPADLQTLKQFKDPMVLTKHPGIGNVEGVVSSSVYQFLSEM